jgi:hypothetical protein
LLFAVIQVTTSWAFGPQHALAQIVGTGITEGALVVPTTLDAAVRSRAVLMSLVGDGVNTASCDLVLANMTGKIHKVHVPKYQVFLPDNAKHQVMMCTADQFIDLLPGAITTLKIPTVCTSAKTVSPPPASGCNYSPGSHPDPAVYLTAIAILETCGSPEMSSIYENVPIAPERRLPTITQLSIWKECGLKTGNPEDQITPQSIKEEFLAAANVPEESLTPQQKEQFNTRIDLIFEAVDLTCKRSRERQPLLTEAPGKPPGAANEPKPEGGTQRPAGTQTRDAAKGPASQPTAAPEQPTASQPGGSAPGCCTQTRPPCPCYVELIWRPMAGFMNFAGDIVYLNTDKQLYHSALRVQLPDPDGSCHHYVIELTDYLEGAEARAVGQVDSIDVYNVFNAGVRLYRDGQPNKADECWPPIRLSTDCAQARRIRDMVARLQFPNMDYGDNVDTGNGQTDDWMCNSLTSFLLTKAGIDTSNPRIRPLGGLTPGWDAGSTLANSSGRLPGR